MIDSLHMPVCRLKESRISPFPFFEAFKYVLSSIPNNSFFVFIVIIPTTLTGIMSYTEVFTDFICELLGTIYNIFAIVYTPNSISNYNTTTL